MPVALGKSWGTKKWRSHFLLGGRANLSFSRTGRTVFNSVLIEYDGALPAVLSDQLSFGLMVGTGLGFQLNDHLRVMTSLQYQRHLNNWTTEEGVRMRPGVLNASVGVRYSW